VANSDAGTNRALVLLSADAFKAFETATSITSESGGGF
jgi:hypothetical protein